MALSMLGENTLPQKAVLPCYCPTMDLIAFATDDGHVLIYRLNGQNVHTIFRKNSQANVTSLAWKPNGQILATAYSDLAIHLISTQTGKIVHQIQCQGSPSKTCCLGWGLSFIDGPHVQSELEASGKAHGLDEILSRDLNLTDLGLPPDLPNALMFLDLESSLPKLSTLPFSGREDEAFSSRASLDALFHSNSKDNHVAADLLFASWSDGSLYNCVFDFFQIGTFGSGQVSSQPPSQLIQHASHPYFSTHAFLAKSFSKSGTELAYVPVDARFLQETGQYLSLLATRSTQLSNLTRYLDEARAQLYGELKSSQDLPRRFIANIEETLQEKENCSFIDAAFHTVATGHCHPCVKEWLVDELGERGHKRWEKAALGGLENFRRLTLENFNPALERFSILLSRLRGLAKFHDNESVLGLSLPDLDRILDTLNCLILLGHTVLLESGEELRRLTAFNAWMKQEIEVQGLDPLSSTAAEMAERDNNLDHHSILEYIRGPLLHSKLEDFLGTEIHDKERPRWDIGNEKLIYDDYKLLLRKFRNGEQSAQHLPGLQALLKRLNDLCQVVFEKISENQKRKVRFGDPVIVDTLSGDDLVNDLRVVPVRNTDTTTANGFYMYALTAQRGEYTFKISAVRQELTNGTSTVKSVEQAIIRLPAASSVRDAKFLDDEQLVLAIFGEESAHLLYLSYARTSQQSDLRYRPASSESASESILDLSSEGSWGKHTRHTFPSADSWIPDRLSVNGRQGRRAMCVLAEDRVRYRIYDIDSTESGNELDEDAMME